MLSAVLLSLLSVSPQHLLLENVRADAVMWNGKSCVRLMQDPGKHTAGFDGLEALAVLAGSHFRDGTIDVELAGKPREGAEAGARGFVGVAFRVRPHVSKFECFYLRPTNGRADDQLRRNHSTQYISYPDFPWQRLRSETPGVYESYVDLETGAWTKMRIVAAGTNASLYVNDAPQPVLIVHDLKHGQSEGAIALWIDHDTEAYFRDVQVSDGGTGASGNGQITADDIIAKYIKTAGGLAALDAMKTLRRTGRYRDSGGFQATFAQERVRPDKVRQEFTYSGMTGITAWDGKTAWTIQPFGGKKDPRTLSDDDRKGIVDDADFEDPFLHYREKGNKVEYLGTDSVEGTETYKLKVTLASTGDVLTYYMDTDSGVPIKVDSMSVVRGAPQETETIVGDYKKVGGWYLPFSTETNAKGSTFKQSITWDKIEANVPLPDERFTMPHAGGAK